MDPSSRTLPTADHPERILRRQQLFARARLATGFMPDDEGRPSSWPPCGPGRRSSGPHFVEIGAWCGKSTVYLGAAAEETDAVVFSLDHHHGSEENQAGWEHHDDSLVDPDTGRIDTLPHWRRTVVGAGLESSVIGLVGDSPTVSSIGRARWPSASSTGGTGWSRPGPTSGVGADGGPGRLAGHPRRLSRPGRRGATALRHLAGRPRLRGVRGGTGSADPCGCCGRV